ncbi:hypothetical protein Tco_0473513, partial [Tanacetum coccineum]
ITTAERIKIAQRKDKDCLWDMYEDIDSESTYMVVASKVPILKPSEFEIWRMRIE